MWAGCTVGHRPPLTGGQQGRCGQAGHTTSCSHLSPRAGPAGSTRPSWCWLSHPDEGRQGGHGGLGAASSPSAPSQQHLPSMLLRLHPRSTTWARTVLAQSGCRGTSGTSTDRLQNRAGGASSRPFLFPLPWQCHDCHTASSLRRGWWLGPRVSAARGAPASSSLPVVSTRL